MQVRPHNRYQWMFFALLNSVNFVTFIVKVPSTCLKPLPPAFLKTEKKYIYISERGIPRNTFQNLQPVLEVHTITFFSLPCDKTLAIQFPVCSIKVRGHEFWLAGGCARVTRPAGRGSLTWERNLSASRWATRFVSKTQEHVFNSFDYLWDLS
jgi:hypothetical protein